MKHRVEMVGPEKGGKDLGSITPLMQGWAVEKVVEREDHHFGVMSMN